MSDKKIIFVLHHEYEQGGSDFVKFIGVFSTEENAEKAIQTLKNAPGFIDWRDGFNISWYEVDAIQWAEGFGSE